MTNHLKFPRQHNIKVEQKKESIKLFKSLKKYDFRNLKRDIMTMNNEVLKIKMWPIDEIENMPKNQKKPLKIKYIDVDTFKFNLINTN